MPVLRTADEVKVRFENVGQVLNGSKEQALVPDMATLRSWVNANPGYHGRVAESVKDLGVGFRAVGARSLDRGDRIGRAVEVCGRVKALTRGPMEKKVIIKAAAQSGGLYGVAVDPIIFNEVRTLRRAYSGAIWPGKGMTSNAIGLLLLDTGRLDPQLEVIKRAVAA